MKKGKVIFTEKEATAIRRLLLDKVDQDRKMQKHTRNELRKHYHFYISDFTSKKGFTEEDFRELISQSQIKITK